MAPFGSKGELGPKSTTKPMFFMVLFHCTEVPALMQKRELLFALAMLGVDEAAFAVRFTSTAHGVDAEPQVFAALHICAGFASAQAYLSAFDWAIAELENITTGNKSTANLDATD
jgi:hypothetical protein